MTPATLSTLRTQPSAPSRGLFSPAVTAPGHAHAAKLLRSHLLLNGQVVSAVAGADPVRVRCLTGEVWITQEGDERDHVLSAGQVWQSTELGRVVVEAVSPAAQVIVE